MVEFLKSIPEFIETSIGESLQARKNALSTFRDLGPPDLAHGIRSNGSREIGSFHYVSGPDASSSASLAAYWNDLTYDCPKGWKFQSGVYCCYDAFSRVDLRVSVKIPGGVEAYVLDDRGNKSETNSALWLEAYVSSILRSLHYADGDAFTVSGYRRFNPFANKEAEARFLEVAGTLFFEGVQLGSGPNVQVSSVVNNHLAKGLLKYFTTFARLETGVKFFSNFVKKEKKLSVLLAQLYVNLDREVDAMALMCDTLLEDHYDHDTLYEQTRFLWKKEEFKMALSCAKAALNVAPSEFTSWANLTEAYIHVNDFKSALLTLNSCPMFTFHGYDSHRMPEPAKINMPRIKGIPDEVMEETDLRQSEVDPELLKLPAITLNGTFEAAYQLLTKISHILGWDVMLNYRSTVFVMEEEYNFEKAKERQPPSIVIHNAPNDTNDCGVDHEHKLDLGQVPVSPKQANGANEVNSSITSKKLCERWLDNLFMQLYEDLRLYVVWQAEWTQAKADEKPYKRTIREWELLGLLALRLHHTQEANEAFEEANRQRFSAKAQQHLIREYERQGRPDLVLRSAARLVAWNARWYSEFSPDLISIVRRLIASQGLVKVRSHLTVEAESYLPFVQSNILSLAEKYEWFGWNL